VQSIIIKMVAEPASKAKFTTFVTFFFWGAFGLGCATLSQTTYIYYTGFEEGLFTKAVPGVRASNVAIDRTPWLDGTCAMMIIGVVFLFSAAFSLQWLSNWYGPSRHGVNLNAWKATLAFGIIGAWTYTIGIAIYTSFVEQGYAGSGNTADASATKYGAGFGMAWGAAGLANIASTLLWIIVSDLTPEYLEQARNDAIARFEAQKAQGGCCC